MRKTKKFVAIIAAMAMALAPTCVYAAPTASGEAASNVDLEGAVKKDYLDYTAPTLTASQFDFVLDPQGLIAKTDGKTVKGNNASVVTEEGATVYFKNGSNYAVSSSALTVTNKASSEITVSVKATMGLDATGAAINIVDEVSTGSSLDLRIHLDQVTGGAASVSLTPDSTITTKSSLSISSTAAAVDADQFEIIKDNGEYKYQPKADATSGGSVSFVFYGECNGSDDADWTAVKGMSATFDVVWDVSTDSKTLVATEPAIATPGEDMWDGNDIWLQIANEKSDITKRVKKVTISIDDDDQIAVSSTGYKVEHNDGGEWVALNFDDEELAPYALKTKVQLWVQIDSKVYTCVLWDNN